MIRRDIYTPCYYKSSTKKISDCPITLKGQYFLRFFSLYNRRQKHSARKRLTARLIKSMPGESLGLEGTIAPGKSQQNIALPMTITRKLKR